MIREATRANSTKATYLTQSVIGIPHRFHFLLFNMLLSLHVTWAAFHTNIGSAISGLHFRYLHSSVTFSIFEVPEFTNGKISPLKPA